MYVYGLTHNAMTKWLHSLKGDSSHNKDNSRKWVARVTRGNRRDRGTRKNNRNRGTGEQRTWENRGNKGNNGKQGEQGGTREGKGNKRNRVTTRTEEKGEHG